MGTTSWRARPPTPAETLDWASQDLRRDLATILGWARQRVLPAAYSCNHDDIWPSVGLGHSSAWERNLRTGQNRLLDAIHRSALRSRSQGGRIDVMADGAYWTESGRQFLAWTYMDPSGLSPSTAPSTPKDHQLAMLQRLLAENQALLARLPGTHPPGSEDESDELTLLFTSDITDEIDDFIRQQTEAYYEQCLINDDEDYPPERFLTWKEFLWEYIDGEELDDGRVIRLTGADTPAAKEIRQLAKAYWRSII